MDTLPPVFEENDVDAQERATAEGIADADAGRLVQHDVVVRWVKSWGTDHEVPVPGCPAT